MPVKCESKLLEFMKKNPGTSVQHWLKSIIFKDSKMKCHRLFLCLSLQIEK